MRLWHIDLIHYLPKSQLIAQWRELNSIYKDQPKHILINYIYNYDKEYLLAYSWAVMNEMYRRKIDYKINNNFLSYFNSIHDIEKDGNEIAKLRYPEHNKRYFQQCFYNLQEKYDREQKGFTSETMRKLEEEYLKVMEEV